jgi:hypothetical protein
MEIFIQLENINYEEFYYRYSNFYYVIDYKYKEIREFYKILVIQKQISNWYNFESVGSVKFSKYYK